MNTPSNRNAAASRRPRSGRPWSENLGALVIAPCCSLFVILLFFLFSVSGIRVGVGYTTCCRIHTDVPRIKGPDPLQRGPVLTVDPDLSTLEAAEMDEGPRSHDDDSPDWKILKLAEQLEVMKANWLLVHPGEAWEGSILLQVQRDLKPQQLRRYLYTIQLAMGNRLQLTSYSSAYSATWVQLVPLDRWAPSHHQGPHTLQLEDFNTYEELVKEAVARRRAGRPVYISII